jgi:FAD/FMN-containing dehydrogenase
MRTWNAAVEHRPAEVVACRTAHEVRAALARAAASGRPVSVYGGGHDWAGRAVRDGGVVLDLTAMRQVTVAGPVATAGGGATSADVMAAAQRTGQAVATGTVGAVGLAGLTLGGGYGPLCGVAGLAADNLIGADVVLADGRLVHTDEHTEPDLFWALRGGGGNFGVVTTLRVRLQPIATVVAGSVMFPWAQAAQVLAGFAELCAEAPAELTAQAGSITVPDVGPVVFINPTWAGPAGAADRWLSRIAGLGSPVVARVAPTSPLEPLRRGDRLFAADDRHYRIATRNVARLTPVVIDTLIEAGAARTSPLSAINLHRFHGAAARVPVEATAFGRRDEHFMVELIGSWRPGDGSADHDWAARTSHRLAPHALPGGYPNLLGPGDDEQTRHAYGPNAPRLAEAKKCYDPGATFHAIALPEQR